MNNVFGIIKRVFFCQETISCSNEDMSLHYNWLYLFQYTVLFPFVFIRITFLAWSNTFICAFLSSLVGDSNTDLGGGGRRSRECQYLCNNAICICILISCIYSTTQFCFPSFSHEQYFWQYQTCLFFSKNNMFH